MAHDTDMLDPTILFSEWVFISNSSFLYRESMGMKRAWENLSVKIVHI